MAWGVSGEVPGQGGPGHAASRMSSVVSALPSYDQGSGYGLVSDCLGRANSQASVLVEQAEVTREAVLDLRHVVA